MSKSTYNEVLDIVTEALEQPDSSVIFKHTALNELKKALEQARKQEKLLELYKELIKYMDLTIGLPYISMLKYEEINNKIKELEK